VELLQCFPCDAVQGNCPGLAIFRIRSFYGNQSPLKVDAFPAQSQGLGLDSQASMNPKANDCSQRFRCSSDQPGLFLASQKTQPVLRFLRRLDAFGRVVTLEFFPFDILKFAGSSSLIESTGTD